MKTDLLFSPALKGHLGLLLLLLALGCGGEDGGGGDVTTSAAEARGAADTLDDGPVASVEILEGPTSCTIGERVTLQAVARDANGDAVDEATIRWSSSGERGLRPEGDGVFLGQRAGIYLISAYVGTVTSPLRPVWVEEASDAPPREVAVRTALPDSLSGRSLDLLGPEGLGAPVDLGDGSFRIRLHPTRNQLVRAVDAETGELLLLGMFRGHAEGLPDETFDTVATLDLRSTAEALLFLQPGIVHRHPMALAGFRKLLADDPAVEELATALTAACTDGDPWTEHLPGAVAPVFATLQARIAAKLSAAWENYETERKAAAEADGDKADTILQELTPRVLPNIERSHLSVSLVSCSAPDLDGDQYMACGDGVEPDQGLLTVTNKGVRWVAAYAEPVDRPVGTIGPMIMMSAGRIPSFWEFIITLDTTQFFGEGAYESSSRVVDFDPTTDGANTWYLTAYGPGAQAHSFPWGLYKGGTAFHRSWLPWLATALFDVVFNLTGILTGDNGGDLAKCALEKLLVDDVDTFMSLGATHAMDYFEGGQWSSLFSLWVDVGGEVIGRCVDEMQGPTGKDTWLKALGSLLTVYNAIAAVVNLAFTGYDVFTSSYADWWALTGNMLPAIDPVSRVFPEGQVGCSYHTEATVLQAIPGVSYEWYRKPDGALEADWSFEEWNHASNPQFFITTREGEVVEEDHLIDGDHVEIYLMLLAGVGEEGALPSRMDYETFRIPVLPAGPQLTTLEVHGHGEHPDRLLPGDPLRVHGVVEHCGHPVGEGGDVSGSALQAPATFSSLGSDLYADGVLRSPLADGAHALEVVATTKGGEQATATLQIEVQNLPPALSSQELMLLPGEEVSLSLDVSDPNFEGDNPEEIPASWAGILGGDDIADPETPLHNVFFHHASEGSGPGVARLVGDPFRIRLPLADTDGPDGAPSPEPRVIGLRLNDDDGAYAMDPDSGVLPDLRITVRNVAPVIRNAPQSINLGSDSPTSTVTIRVTDDNGLEDLGDLEIIGPSHGLTFTGVDDLGDERRFHYQLIPAAVMGTCGDICTVTFQAADKDDMPENGGLSEPYVLQITVGGFLPCGDASDCPAHCLPGGLSEWRDCVDGACGTKNLDDCNATGQVCVQGHCADECAAVDDCPGGGAPGCQGGALVTWSCGNGGCVATPVTCTEGTTCLDGGCRPGCLAAGCPDQCAGAGAFQQGSCQPDGACVYGPALACEADTVCKGGACVPACQLVGCPAMCSDDGDLVLGGTCLPDGTCAYQPVQACVGGASCAGGACVLGCLDLGCPDQCSADSAAVEAGECQPDGSCDYTPVTTCLEGFHCHLAACVPDCAADADCPLQCNAARTAVLAGTCQPDGGCAWEDEWALCVGASICHQGACVPACAQDADCPAPGCADLTTQLTSTCQDQACVSAVEPCGGALVCDGGQCIPPCQEPWDCPRVCDNQGSAVLRACQPDGLCGAIAVDDCPAQGKGCDEGFCVAACPGGDAQACPYGGQPLCLDGETLIQFHCVNELCEPEMTPCGLLETCQVDQCVSQGCETDGDCPGLCQDGTHRVLYTCVDGTCAPGAPELCPWGELCVQGGCATPCSPPDVGCAPGETCVVPGDGGTPWCRECASPADCPHEGAPYCGPFDVVRQEACVDHHCVAQDVQDCPAQGLVCADGACHCVADDDCPDDCFGPHRMDGECFEGLCTLTLGPTCPNGWWCVEGGQCGQLCGPDQPCPAGWDCVAGPGGIQHCRECAVDADCPDSAAPYCVGDESRITRCVDYGCGELILEDCGLDGGQCQPWTGTCGAPGCDGDEDCEPPGICVPDGQGGGLCGCAQHGHCPHGGAPACADAGEAVIQWRCQEDLSCAPEEVLDCATLLGTCQDGSCVLDEHRPCCSPHPGVGCVDEAACDLCVCAELPHCCDPEDPAAGWDLTCVERARGSCQAECGCDAPCCAPHVAGSCDDSACAWCVCEAAPACCAGTWGPECVALAEGACAGICGCPGSPCAPHPEPLSGSYDCDACVCFGPGAAPQCCLQDWDMFCAVTAAEACPDACGCTGPCCDGHGGAGCEDGLCEVCVCAMSPDCCADAWDPECAALAQSACAFECQCPGSGCAAHDAPGCDDAGCEACVCLEQGLLGCCEAAWDVQCADVAHVECLDACKCPGGCCAAHPGGGCDAPLCAACVAAALPTCAEGPWDAACVAAAAGPCLGACQCPGTCCDGHEAPGCDDTGCAALVCALEPGCCQDGWLPLCAALAGKHCGTTCGDCAQDDDCVDGSECNAGLCVDSHCVFTPEPAFCDDSVGCTVDTCLEGACQHTPDDAYCDDGVGCTLDKCSDTGCVHPPDPELCDDGIDCTIDTCEDGQCKHTPHDLLCGGAGICYTYTCDPLSGCQQTGWSNALCNDGNICTWEWCNDEVGLCVYEPEFDGLECLAETSPGVFLYYMCIDGVCRTDLEPDCGLWNKCWVNPSWDYESGWCSYEAKMPPECTDGLVCTTDGCDGDTGECTNLDICSFFNGDETLDAVCVESDATMPNWCKYQVKPASWQIGCSDGSREGLLDLYAYPAVAACAGGWTEYGLYGQTGMAGNTLSGKYHDHLEPPHYQVPHCKRKAGNDGWLPDGQGCTASDLCAAGWRICGPDELAAIHQTIDWGGANLPSGSFFAVDTSFSPSSPGSCSGGTPQSIVGIGDVGLAAPQSCQSGYGVTSQAGTLCEALPSPWTCGTDPMAVGLNVRKPGIEAGGVLCCRSDYSYFYSSVHTGSGLKSAYRWTAGDQLAKCSCTGGSINIDCECAPWP